MVRRTNMTRPRIRLRQGEEPTAVIDRLYASGQLDFPKGNIRLSRSGEIQGSPTGFTGQTDEHQPNQMPEDKHGAGYNNDTPPSWVHGGDAEARKGFDHHNFRHPTPGGLRATGGDMEKSPFSAAGRNFKRER